MQVRLKTTPNDGFPCSEAAWCVAHLDHYQSGRFLGKLFGLSFKKLLCSLVRERQPNCNVSVWFVLARDDLSHSDPWMVLFVGAKLDVAG